MQSYVSTGCRRCGKPLEPLGLRDNRDTEMCASCVAIATEKHKLLPKAPKSKELNKYQRYITGDSGTMVVDVYDVLKAFETTNPAVDHAIKKLLCPGLRGVKGRRQDIEEAKGSLVRALELEEIK
jgi:hypothetical protein